MNAKSIVLAMALMGVGVVPCRSQAPETGGGASDQAGFPSLRRSSGLVHWDRDFVGGVQGGMACRIVDSTAYLFKATGRGFQLEHRVALPPRPEAQGAFLGGPHWADGRIAWATTREVYVLEGARWVRTAHSGKDWIPGMNPGWHEVRALSNRRLLVLGGPRNWIELLDLESGSTLWSEPFPMTTAGRPLPGPYRQPSVLQVNEEFFMFLPYSGRVFRVDPGLKAARELEDLPWPVDDRDVGHEGRANRLRMASGEGTLQPWPLAAFFVPKPGGDPILVACFQPEMPLAGQQRFEIRNGSKVEKIEGRMDPMGFWTASGDWGPLPEAVEAAPGAGGPLP